MNSPSPRVAALNNRMRLASIQSRATLAARALRCGAIVCILAGMAWPVVAGSNRCTRCSCQQPCKKVCRLVCETKKVTKVEYCCECEDFCVPGPSKCCPQAHCDSCCDTSCGKTWIPTCACVRTRTKLVKKEVSHDVPSYKWVVDEVCCGCGQCARTTTLDGHPVVLDSATTFDAAPGDLPPGELPEAGLISAAAGDDGKPSSRRLVQTLFERASGR